MGAKAKPKTEAPASDGDVETEKVRLLKEMNILSDRKEAIEQALDARKARMRELLNTAGERDVESEYYGGAGYSPRRSFKVTDPKKLAKRCTKEFLASGFRATAALVDALGQKGIGIDGMITIGVSESFSYRRPATKDAKERRKRIIAESRAAAEQKVAEIIETLD